MGGLLPRTLLGAQEEGGGGGSEELDKYFVELFLVPITYNLYAGLGQALLRRLLRPPSLRLLGEKEEVRSLLFISPRGEVTPAHIS